MNAGLVFVMLKTDTCAILKNVHYIETYYIY
jgi:hypothetical protein